MGVFAKAAITRGTALVVESPLMNKSKHSIAWDLDGLTIVSTNVVRALQLYADEKDILLGGKVCGPCNLVFPSLFHNCDPPFFFGGEGGLVHE